VSRLKQIGLGMGTRERLKARIAALEEHRRQQQPPTETVSLFFVSRSGSLDVCNIATGPGGFICHRLAGESIEDFKRRADIEVLATRPKLPIVGLIFRREEGHDDAV
jgi:hypothetical protein